MRRFGTEAALALLAIAIAAAVWHLQSPARLLHRAEVDGYIARIEPALALPPAEKAALIGRLRSWGESDDGKPVYMLNLMRFYDAPRTLVDLAPFTGTPRELNARYERVAIPLLLRLGAYPLFEGEPRSFPADGAKGTNLSGFDASLENWSRVLIVRYPDRRSFFDLLSNPDYLPVMPYKLAALELLLMPMQADLLLPDPRWLLTGLLAASWCIVAAWRAGSRRRKA